VAKRRNRPTYFGIEFDSPEELEFYWWCEEAHDRKLIQDFSYQHPTWELTPKATEEVQRVSEKTGKQLKPKTRTIVQAATYTCDFWLKGLADSMSGIPEFIDIKPKFERDQSRARLFSLTRKFVYYRHGVLVEAKTLDELFTATWAPTRATVTPKTGKPRKPYQKYKTVQDFIRSQK